MAENANVRAILARRRRLHHVVHRAQRRAQPLRRNIIAFGNNNNYEHPIPTGVPTGLNNDEGASVCLGTEDFHIMYCNRVLGPDAIPGSDGRCGPDNGPQCPSCQRLQASYRLESLKRTFPHDTAAVTEDALVAALRGTGGLLNQAQQKLIDELGAVPQPDERICDAMAASCGYPRAIVKAAFQKTACNTAEAANLLYTDIESCFEAAEAASSVTGKSPPAGAVDPDAMALFGASATQFTPLSSAMRSSHHHQLQHPVVITNGHFMVRVDTNNKSGAQNERKKCALCSCHIPSRLTGSYQCRMCSLCEACVQTKSDKTTKLVFHCPALANGGHLHHHAMYFDVNPAKNAHCDIKGDGCMQNHVTWRCSTCDFDVCPVCMARPAPPGFNRRTGTATINNTSTASTSDNGTADGLINMNVDDHDGDVLAQLERMYHMAGAVPNMWTTNNGGHFDADAAEQDVADRWQQELRRHAGSSKVVVGGGCVGNTVPVNKRGSRSIHRVARSQPRSAPTVSILSGEAKEALEQFKLHKSANDLETTVSQNSEVTATDLTLAEDLLQRAQTLKDSAVRVKVHEAVAAGNLGIAGTLVLMPSCTKVTAPTGDCSTCWCGDTINVRSAPDGAVCCLNGHAAHPSCAADLLLGGAPCPTCRESLFFSRLADAEANSAAELLLQETSSEQSDDFVASSDGPTLEMGDVVQVTADNNLCCMTQENDPMTGGWFEDMSDACGLQGLVTGVIKHEEETVAVQVQSKKPIEEQKHFLRRLRERRPCENCRREVGANCVFCAICISCCSRREERTCRAVSHVWTWAPSLISFIRKSPKFVPAEGTPGKTNEMDTKRNEAQRHLLRLRAELLAVKAARERAEEETKSLAVVKSGELPAMSKAALTNLGTSVSAADYQRAHHLLVLADELGVSAAAKEVLAAVQVDAREGRLESAARKIRLFNALQTVEEASWRDASMPAAEYVVSPSLKAPLLAFPVIGAPKTGFYLEPGSHFWSGSEHLDNNGAMWLKVAVPKSTEAPNSERAVIACDADSENFVCLIRSRVCRGKDWRFGDQDGGEGNEGIIVEQTSGAVAVKWNGIDRSFTYQARADGPVYLILASELPPQQGWLCLRAGGPGSPLAASRVTTALSCSCCGRHLLPSAQANGDIFASVDERKICKGDRLLVAATLEAVDVVRVEDHRVFCTFPQTEGRGRASTFLDPSDDEVAPDCHEASIERPSKRSRSGSNNEDDGKLVWYRPQDLVVPTEGSFEETKVIENQPRTRREVVLMNDGILEKAKQAWNQAQDMKTSTQEHKTTPFASCVRGHLLHTRCFQTALLSGSLLCPVPGCSEPLWAPSVRRMNHDVNNDSCCGEGDSENSRDGDVDMLGGETLGGPCQEEAGDDVAAATTRGPGSLKMCPCCCSGPFLNEHCSNMSSHHGECTATALGRTMDLTMCTSHGIFRASTRDITEALMKVSSTKTVAQVLPRCPTHDVPVVFNGCTACGYLFTGVSWTSLPNWDPNGKAKLEIDKTKLNAAKLLAAQVRKETAMLQYTQLTLEARGRKDDYENL